jgi:hypothetical protein
MLHRCLAWALALFFLSVEAFVVVQPHKQPRHWVVVTKPTPRAAAAADDSSNSSSETTEKEMALTDITTKNDEDDTSDEKGETDDLKKEEAAALAALKADIDKLGAQLKDKRRQLAYTADQAEELSAAGYARKVAEMENMRRARSVRTFFVSNQSFLFFFRSFWLRCGSLLSVVSHSFVGFSLVCVCVCGRMPYFLFFSIFYLRYWYTCVCSFSRC